MVNGDAESRSHWVTYTLGTILGTKGAGNAVKSTRVGSNVTKAAKESVKNATNKAANIQMPNLFPYGPQHQLATVGPVPYNVVDGVNLRDQIMMFAKQSSTPINNKVRIINKKFAGKTYKLDGDLAKKYPDGVRFTLDGFPDFSPYSKINVKIEGLKGNTSSDFTAANRAVGLKSTPKGFTWHHVEDGKTLMLVPTDLHQTVRHTGGAALIRKGLAP